VNSACTETLAGKRKAANPDGRGLNSEKEKPMNFHSERRLTRPPDMRKELRPCLNQIMAQLALKTIFHSR